MKLASRSIPSVVTTTCPANLDVEEERRAIRVKFYRNGDRYYGGIEFPISSLRYRNFGTLIRDLNTSVFCDQKRLPHGVRYIFALDGTKINSIHDMIDGGSYVCSSTNRLIPMDYVRDTFNPVWKTTTHNCDYMPTKPLVVKDKHPIRSYSLLTNTSVLRSKSLLKKHSYRTVIIIKHGLIRPRKMFKWTFCLDPLPSFNQVIEELCNLLSLKNITHLCNTEGLEMTTVSEMLKVVTAFIVFTNEIIDETEYLLTNQELTLINMLKEGKSVGYISEATSVEGTANCKKPWQKLNDLYDIGNQISSGNFATVRLCRNKNTNVYSAVKRIDMQENSDDMMKVKKEVEILKKMNHANIIKLVEEFEMNGYFYLVMELITDGDIISTIMNSKYYSEQDVSGMVHNVMSGILYLHSINIVHRDIKMENVLVQKNRNGLKKLKICDFGLATSIANNEILKTVCGTPNYMAPEIILQVGYGNKVDVWSVGIFMYILLFGSPPFYSRSNDFNKIFENVIVGKYDLTSTTWESVSEEAKTLITMLLEPNPTNRMTAEEALSYPWVSKDQFARNINLRPTIGSKLQKYYRNTTYVMKKGNNVLANTALDKESNYFEKAQNETALAGVEAETEEN